MASDLNSNPLKEIILRAWTDPSFKEQLKNSPSTIISDFGLKIASGRNIIVVENSDDDVYFVLPARPNLDQLSNEQIRELVDSVLGVQLVLPTIL